MLYKTVAPETVIYNLQRAQVENNHTTVSIAIITIAVKLIEQGECNNNNNNNDNNNIVTALIS